MHAVLCSILSLVKKLFSSVFGYGKTVIYDDEFETKEKEI